MNRSTSASNRFSDTTTTERNLLFHFIGAAADARTRATVEATKSKRVSAWKHWNTFLYSVRIADTMFLEGFNEFQRNIIISAFAQAVRDGTYATRTDEPLVEGSVCATISYVAQTFRANNRPDPQLDSNGKTCFLLTEQWRAYRNMDGSRQKQKALPMKVLRKMHELAITEWEVAVSWLLVGAIFFAMRSCEYLQTSHKEDKHRTKILRMKNIQFLKDGRRLDHNDKRLQESDIVMITFEFQKNDSRDQQVHMFKTTDKILNPVQAWAVTVQRIRSYSDTNNDTTVCTFKNKVGESHNIQADQVRTQLQSVVDIMGERELGFTKDDVGLHSLRSGGAMAMFLSGTSTITIKKIGRWSSEAFLEYIREQVEDFTAGVAQKMLEFENFNNLQRPSPQANNHNIAVNKGDGLEVIPYTVNFSDLALNIDKERRKQWHQR